MLCSRDTRADADATGEKHDERNTQPWARSASSSTTSPGIPSSRQNQTLLFEAEERQREEQQRLEERQEELKQERAREELDALLPNRGGAKPAGIDFMYKAPSARTPKARRRARVPPTRPPWRLKRDGSRRRGGKGASPSRFVEKAPEPEPIVPEPEPERPPPSSKTFDAHAEARRVDPAERQRNLTSAAIAQTALDARNRLVLKAAATAAVASDGVVRAHGSANEGYALLDDDDEEEDADAALLASLSSREKRALLKRLAGDDDARVLRRNARRSTTRPRPLPVVAHVQEEKEKARRRHRRRAAAAALVSFQ